MCEQLTQISEAEQSLHEMVYRLQQCPDINVPDAYHAVMRTTEHLFWLEQELMRPTIFHRDRPTSSNTRGYCVVCIAPTAQC